MIWKHVAGQRLLFVIFHLIDVFTTGVLICLFKSENPP